MIKIHTHDPEKMLISCIFTEKKQVQSCRTFPMNQIITSLDNHPSFTGLSHEFIVFKTEKGLIPHYDLKKITIYIKVLGQWKEFPISEIKGMKEQLWSNHIYYILQLDLQRDLQRSLRYALLSFPTFSFPYNQ